MSHSYIGDVFFFGRVKYNYNLYTSFTLEMLEMVFVPTSVIAYGSKIV